MDHKGTRAIETERLLLRPFCVSDAKAMYRNWASSPEVVRYLTWPVHPSPEATKELLKQWAAGYADPSQYLWCVELKETGEAIGSLSVVRMEEETAAAEIGYCIGKAYWHKGLMAEAFRPVIRFLFEEAGCLRVSARHDVNNPNSGRVMQKCGLLFEGIHKQSGKNNTGICDMAVYAITKEDYDAHRRREAFRQKRASLRSFGGINLSSPEPEKLVGFYHDLLGLPVLEGGEDSFDGTELGFLKDGPRIWVWDETKWGKSGGGSANLVFYADDLSALWEVLQKHGYKAEPPRRMSWGGEELSLFDPEGNKLTILKA